MSQIFTTPVPVISLFPISIALIIFVWQVPDREEKPEAHQTALSHKFTASG